MKKDNTKKNSSIAEHLKNNQLDFEVKDQKLLELTNKFLDDYFELYRSLPEHGEFRDRDDSFVFNYSLPKMLAQHPIASRNGDYPLLGSGFVREINQLFFNNQIRGFAKDIQYLIKNFKKQEPYEDYKATNLKVEKKTVKKEEMNVDFLLKRKGKPYINVSVEEVTTTFNVVNNKSGFKGKVVMKQVKGGRSLRDIENIEFYAADGTNVLTISFDLDRNKMLEGKYELIEKGDIKHFKYCADINSFLTVIQTVCVMIGETLKQK